MFSPQSRLRHAVADTFAMVVYCSVVNMLIEIFLSGMTFEQSLSSRLVAIPVNILIAWPYGMYRDAIMRVARKASPASWGEESGGCTGLRHLPVSGLCRNFVDGRRRLAPDYSGSQFEYRDIHADGRGLRLLP
ncbi:L-alanine exporter AlaE [Citrobacter koseri]|nr:L-alanine exporter AlaE [Citrobacter koseri]